MRTDVRVIRVVFAAFMSAASVLLMHTGAEAAQADTSHNADLARQVDRRFSVLPITDGIVLTPKTQIVGVRSIELASGTISVDGAPVTGAELRKKIGADADMVIQASYLTAAEQRALAGGAPAASAPAPDQPPSAREDRPGPGRGGRGFDFQFQPRSRGGDVVHMGREVRVEAGDTVRGNAVSIGRNVTVLGEVRGDAVAVGGNVELGPYSVVSGNVVAVGGTVHRDPSARVGGEVQEISWNSRFSNIFRRSWSRPDNSGWSVAAPVALVLTITRMGVLVLLAMLVLLLGGNYVERVGNLAVAEPLKAAAVGFLAQIIFFPLLIVTILLLVVTIIGIPLLVLIPFAILGLVLVALVGFTAVASRVGRMVGAKMSWGGGPYLLTTAGIIILVTPVLLARVVGLGGFPVSFLSIFLVIVGAVIEYVAWTIGFGAVALTRFSKAQAAAPLTSSLST